MKDKLVGWLMFVSTLLFIIFGFVYHNYRRKLNEPTYFNNCTEAKQLGYDNITSDDPAYRSGLDRDDDGLACEPYRY